RFGRGRTVNSQNKLQLILNCSQIFSVFSPMGVAESWREHERVQLRFDAHSRGNAVQLPVFCRAKRWPRFSERTDFAPAELVLDQDRELPRELSPGGGIRCGSQSCTIGQFEGWRKY